MREATLSGGLELVSGISQDLDRARVMLTFQGGLTPELITALLGSVELRMSTIEPDARLRKRVFSVVMECLQNLFHHHSTSTDARSGGTQGIVIIAQSEGGYSVITGNRIASDEVQELKDHLDRVNGCDTVQLRELYQHTLSNGRYGRRGGAGLGIIDLARRSGRKLEYGFVPLDNADAFFSLNVNVTA